MFSKKPCPCNCGEVLGGTRWKAMREHQENAQLLDRLARLDAPHRYIDLIAEGESINQGLELHGHFRNSRHLPSLTERAMFQNQATAVLQQHGIG